MHIYLQSFSSCLLWYCGKGKEQQLNVWLIWEISGIWWDQLMMAIQPCSKTFWAVIKMFVMSTQARVFPLCLALNIWIKQSWRVRNVLLADILLVISYCCKPLYFQKQVGLESKILKIRVVGTKWSLRPLATQIILWFYEYFKDEKKNPSHDITFWLECQKSLEKFCFSVVSTDK